MTKIKETVSKVKTDISGKWVSIEEVEKLVEIVIRDCAQVVFKNTGPKSALNVLEHFGVEE